MTRKDYELIARVISGLSPGTRQVAAKKFAVVFQQENPRFNEAKWYKACGVEIENG